jgi:DNA-binding NarL/FixJ family response regulator
MPVSILIADDHEIMRNGLRELLEREPGWVVTGAASTGRQAVTMAIELKPDVVVLDILMPEMGGLDAARQIRRSLPAAIVLISTSDAQDVEQEVLEAGADAYVGKAESAERLIEIVRKTLAVRQVAGGLPPKPVPSTKKGANGRAANTLTAREREVLRLLAEGCTNKQVAARLGITTKTAETHRAHIIAKLKLHSVSGLVRYAIRHRIIDA